MKYTTQIVRATGFLIVSALAFGVGTDGAWSLIGVETAALAQGQASAEGEKQRRVPNIAKATFLRLQDAQELVAAERWQEAAELLNAMVERSRRYNGNERGQIHNLLAYVNYKLGNIELTVHHYEQVLAQVPDISELLENATLEQLSKLHAQADYRSTERILRPDRSSTTEALPIAKVAPIYPRRAYTRGIEGHVLLEFLVTSTGAVRDPVVVEAKPPGMFDQSAIDAALEFKYKPKVVNGEPMEVAGMRHLIKFELQNYRGRP